MSEPGRTDALTGPPRRFRRYPEYRDSGVEWLGEIPAGWEVKPFKALLSRNETGVWGEDTSQDGTIVLRSTEQTVDGRWVIENPAMRLLSKREAGQARLETDDLVVTKSSGSELHIGKTCIVDDTVAALNCAFSNFMQRLRVREPHMARYFWYLLNSPVTRGQFNYLSSTTTGLGNLNGSILGAINVPRPSEEEQRAIAAFLDRETARIDALVAKKERLIELLQEKRMALVTRAVTQGLDPGVPMKESGVEWLGEIPVGWNVKRLWHLTPRDRKIMYGIVLPGPDVGDGVPIVKGGDVSPSRLQRERLSRTTHEIDHDHAKSRLRTGDLVYAIRGSIGEVAMIPDELQGANLTQDAARVSYVESIDGRWLLHTLTARVTFAQLEAGALGATIRGINIRDLKRVSISVPNTAEQFAIAEYLDSESAKLNALIAKVQEAIDRLKELRTALVSAAVTGKIDVREEAA